VLKEVAVAFRRDNAKVEAQPVVRDNGCLRRATRNHFGHPGKFREMGRERSRVAGGGDDVEVADRLAAPAHASSFGDTLGSRVLPKLLDCLLDGRQHPAEQGLALHLGFRLG